METTVVAGFHSHNIFITTVVAAFHSHNIAITTVVAAFYSHNILTTFGILTRLMYPTHVVKFFILYTCVSV